MKKALAIILSVLILSCMCACNQQAQQSSSASQSVASTAPSDELKALSNASWQKDLIAHVSDYSKTASDKFVSGDSAWFSEQMREFQKESDAIPAYTGDSPDVKAMYDGLKKIALTHSINANRMEMAITYLKSGDKAKADECVEKAESALEESRSTLSSIYEAIDAANK